MKTSPEAAFGSAETKNNPLFYEAYAKEITTLCNAFDIDDRSLEGVLAATQPWAKGDHYDPQIAFQLTLEQKRAVYDMADAANMLDEVPMPSERLNRVILLGGEQQTNQQRADWLTGKLDTGEAELAIHGKIVALGGNRALKGREIFPLGLGIERADYQDPWLTAKRKAEVSEVLTEDAGLRIALLASLGRASLQQMHLRLGLANEREIIQHRILDSPHGEVMIVNAKATERPLGPSRHTTESSLNEWLDLDSALRGDETVVLVSSNPYIPRTARNFHATITNRYPNMHVYTCGPQATDDELLTRRIMGEITRNIYEDYQHLTVRE